MTERVAHRVLIIIALLGLASGTVAYLAGQEVKKESAIFDLEQGGLQKQPLFE